MDKYNELVGSMAFWNLDEVAKFLIAAREHGIHIVYTFNGVDLDSDKIMTVDDAYKIVSGYSKEDFEAKRQEELKRIIDERSMEDNQDKVNSNIK